MSLALGWLSAAVPARAAATIIVTSLEDTAAPCTGDTVCTLRGAVATAQDGDIIAFRVSGTIPVASTLTISRSITIQGPGADSLTLDGQQAVRVMLVDANATVSVSGLTIRNGASDRGAAIRNFGTLTVANSAFRNNVTTNFGGAIYSGATATIAGSTFTGNSTVTTGGAIYTVSSGVGEMTIKDSTFTGNFARFGGAIGAQSSDTTVSGSTISGNTATDYGGAFEVTGRLTLTDSTVSANTSRLYGAGIYNTGAVTLTNSTLSGNSAVSSGAVARGGAIYNFGPLTVTNSTIVRNVAEEGGGIYHQASVEQVRNTIIADSTGGNCSALVTSLGNNLSDTAECFASDAAQNDRADTDPLLLGLSLNGGTTMTHALRSGSPAIDGVTYDSGADCGTTVRTDQRGVTRPQIGTGSRCDIGAYEAAGSAPTIATVGAVTVDEDATTAAIPVTVSDVETPLGDLMLRARSSDQTIVPDSGIVLGGSGANRTLTIAPLPNRNGPVDVTLTVSDGMLQASATLAVTVTPVNDAPTVSVGGQATPAPQTVAQDSALVFSTGSANAIVVTDIDAGSAPVRLALTATHGTLSLNGTAGLNVVSGGNGSPSITVTGPLAALTTALNGLRFTPTAGYAGPATVQVTIDDLGNTGAPGPKSDTETIPVTVTAAPPAPPTPTASPTPPAPATPTALNDGYTAAANQPLVILAASGLLANDSGAGSGGLQAQVVAGPANGLLDLKPDGSFTYRPASNYVGSDTFTYRASNGSASSVPATVTITVTSQPCAPRATVKVTSAVVGGRLQATVEALPLDGRTNNRLHSLRFGDLQNAMVTLNGKAVASGDTYESLTDMTRVTFTVDRATPGLATTVPITAVDECGAWPSFVGAGQGLDSECMHRPVFWWLSTHAMRRDRYDGPAPTRATPRGLMPRAR